MKARNCPTISILPTAFSSRASIVLVCRSIARCGAISRGALRARWAACGDGFGTTGTSARTSLASLTRPGLVPTRVTSFHFRSPAWANFWTVRCDLPRACITCSVVSHSSFGSIVIVVCVKRGASIAPRKGANGNSPHYVRLKNTTHRLGWRAQTVRYPLRSLAVNRVILVFVLLLAHTALWCACGGSILRNGRCARCDRRQRLSRERIEGRREETLERDGYACVLCARIDDLVVHHWSRLWFGAAERFRELWREQHRGQAWQLELPLVEAADPARQIFLVA